MIWSLQPSGPLILSWDTPRLPHQTEGRQEPPFLNPPSWGWRPLLQWPEESLFPQSIGLATSGKPPVLYTVPDPVQDLYTGGISGMQSNYKGKGSYCFHTRNGGGLNSINVCQEAGKHRPTCKCFHIQEWGRQRPCLCSHPRSGQVTQ